MPTGDVSAVGPVPRRATPLLSMAAWSHFMQVAKPYWEGDQRRTAWALLWLLVLLMLAETHFAVLLNDQTGEMTSALAARDPARFWASVQACLWIFAVAVPIYAFYYFMRDRFSNKWRRWLTLRFLDGYLDGRKYYELLKSEDIDNPDQRISEDINTFTGRSTHFLLIFLGSVMQLVAFSAVLWSISKPLVAFLAVYALVGTVVALAVFGSPLIQLNFWQLRREADFRFSLVRLRENAESVAFYRGEKQERVEIERRFDAAYNNFRQLIRRQRSLNLFQRGFGQLSIILPFVLLAREVLSGELEIGRAVQAAGAFAAVLGAVSLIVDNFESLSRFVAGIGRLHALAQRVLDTPGGTAAADADLPRIQRREGLTLELESLDLYTPQGERMLVKGLNLSLQPGEALMITGASGCGKSSLLRAIAGLWHTGRGTVQHPPEQDLFFLPQQPYLQPGSLRSQLIYPGLLTELSDEQLKNILNDVRLGDLVSHVGGLDAVHDWEKLLSVGEQQRLALARVLVRPRQVVFLDEATSAIDLASEGALYEHLRQSGATLVSVAHRVSLLRHHDRVLHLKGNGDWGLYPAQGFNFER